MQERPDPTPAAEAAPNPHAYDPKAVEAAARRFWNQTRAFEVNEADPRPKYYCLSMLPYPSGALHMGHVRNYTIGDVISRYQRMNGRNVLQPMGWDAFGLPAENAAIKNRTAPAKWTYANIEHMRGQLETMGYAIDWTREFATCRPDYYVHEQRMFVRLFRKGLAYRKQSVVNWDPVDQTVLANEQVIDGRGWRTGAIVEKREIPQWFLKITDYAQELLDGLDRLPGWPESVKTMQRNWIGRSEGLEIDFGIAGEHGGRESLKVFTTRPDTLMGVTFVSIAAEHPLALRAAAHDHEIADFIEECRHGGTATAEIETQEKKGIFTGFHAVHPVSGERIPVWIANFVLMGYGTGAVMAVPGHDERDWEFARKYDLPIKMVVVPDHARDALQEISRDVAQHSDAMGAALGESRAISTYTADAALEVVQEFENSIHENGAWTEYGTCVNSGELDGLEYEQAFEALAAMLERDGKGARRVNFRLRDWGVSRQRYWGCPIPIIYCAKCGAVPVPEDQLPVVLPEDVAFMGTGSPIKADPNWRKTTCPTCGGAAERETDTFDTFMESSWYYARYTSPGAADMVDARAKHWLPVDQYIGGIEHAILHLLYFRFFHKLLRDEGLVDSDEPAVNLLCQGMVIAETFYREDKHGSRDWINPDQVEVVRDARGHVTGAKSKADGQPVKIGGIEKMSKSKNNGVDPQTMVDKYGADTVRLFSMFAAPPEQSLEWNEAGVEGCARFLRRVWKFFEDVHACNWRGSDLLKTLSWDRAAADPQTIAVRREIHSLLKQARYDYQRIQLNTVVSAAMKMLNQLETLGVGDSAGLIAPGETVDATRAAHLQRAFVRREGQKFLVKILNPIAPHIAHALWQKIGHDEELIENRIWPDPDPDALQRDTLTLAVQVNGKLRGTIEVAADATREAVERSAQAESNVAKFLEGQQVRKIIVAPPAGPWKIVNIVASA